MITSTERPWGSHDLEERMCEYCGEYFYAHHGLQRYCPEKFGRKDYCKYEQKKLFAEKKLADNSIDLTRGGRVPYYEPDSLTKNVGILCELMSDSVNKNISSDILDQKGYKVKVYDFKERILGKNSFRIHAGEFIIEWIGQDNSISTFKITRK